MHAAGKAVAGRYVLSEKIAAGGMGAVWKAVHVELDTAVAVKFPHTPAEMSTRAFERFRREARAAAKLRSPHVVRILDFGVDRERPFLVMELLEGDSVQTVIDQQGMLPIARAVDFVRQAAEALDAVHAARIVHRDIKPSNLFITPGPCGGSLKLIDFGIAQWGDPLGSPATDSNRLVGSLLYMSPEQVAGEPLDSRSDLWSLGVTAYQMLTGKIPFAGANTPATLRKIASGAFEPISRVNTALQAFDAVFEKAFQLDRGRRFGSAGELSRALTMALAQIPDTILSASLEQENKAWVLGREQATHSMPQSSSGTDRRNRSLVAGIVALAALGAVVSQLAPHDAGVDDPVKRPHAVTTIASSSVIESSRSRSAAVVPSASVTPPPARTPVARIEPRVTPPAGSQRAKRQTEPAKVPVSFVALQSSAAPRPEQPRPILDPVFGLEVPR
jgi:serine/threonine protein kinase